MRKRKHIEKFSADGRILWYAAALCGMLLFCLAPIMLILAFSLPDEV